MEKIWEDTPELNAAIDERVKALTQGGHNHSVDANKSMESAVPQPERSIPEPPSKCTFCRGYHLRATLSIQRWAIAELSACLQFPREDVRTVRLWEPRPGHGRQGGPAFTGGYTRLRSHV